MQESFLWKSCGALVNNRTSSPVKIGPWVRFLKDLNFIGPIVYYGAKLWSELVVACPIPWPLCRPAHPLMTPAYLEFNKALQDLFQWHWYLLAENCEVGPLPWLPTPPCRTRPFRPHPCRQCLYWQCQPACETRWSRPQLSPSARLVPETLWKNKQTIYLVLPFLNFINRFDIELAPWDTTFISRPIFGYFSTLILESCAKRSQLNVIITE
jgi:hypothetical protein